MHFRDKTFLISLLLVALSALISACSDDASLGGGADFLPTEKRTVSGFVQKGPFLRGSVVSVLELDAETFVPTGFVSEGTIRNDSGAYSVELEGFLSPNVLVKAEGMFHNEFTGKATEIPVVLYALANLSGRNSVNVNLLTYLEHRRVLHLVASNKLTLEEAKTQAEREVFEAFGIVGDFALAEDLNIYGEGDGNAALLAISMLMMGGLGEDNSSGLPFSLASKSDNDSLEGVNLVKRMSDFAESLEKDGTWTNERVLANMADWAVRQDTAGMFGPYSKTVAAYMANFWRIVYNLAPCDASSQGYIRLNENRQSKFYKRTFECNDGKWGIVDLEEDDDEVVTDTAVVEDTLFAGIKSFIKKDTKGQECTSFGQIVRGAVNPENMYFCYGKEWKRFYGSKDITYIELDDDRDGRVYRAVLIGKDMWMAENLNYDVGNGFVPGSPYDTYGGYYKWSDIENACPAHWHVPSKEEWEYLNKYMEGDHLAFKTSYPNIWTSGTDAYGFSVVPARVLFDGKNTGNEENTGFWTSSFEEVGTSRLAYSFVVDENAAMLKSEYNDMTRMSIRCIRDFEWTRKCSESNLNEVARLDRLTYYVCREDGWISMTAEEYEVYSGAAGHEGDAKEENDSCYVYEDGSWQKRDDTNCLYALGGCTAARQGEIAQSPKNELWFTCHDGTWKYSEPIDVDTRLWEKDCIYGDVNVGPVYHYYYVCQNGWRYGTYLDSVLVSLGGTACLVEGDTSSVKYAGMYFVCEKSSERAPREWENAPMIYNDTYEDRSECNAAGLYGDGTIHDKHSNIDRKYVCDKGSFRYATERERQLGRGCVSYIYGETVKLGHSNYTCDESGWSIAAGELETGSFVDSRDGREYKTIGIWNYVWMAENLDYADSVAMPELEGNRWCYDDKPAKCAQYGSLYSSTVAKDVCPAGWHLPTTYEWYMLLYFTRFMDENEIAVLRSTSGWIDYKGLAANGNDRLGFTALPGGLRYDEGPYDYEGHKIVFWVDGEDLESQNLGLAIDYKELPDFISFDNEDLGFYVRCIKDST